jgi:UDP:flavonoid glycosyltransferase YjiC (YdhE family)
MKFLLSSIPAIGHVYPMIEVGKELKKRGHDVAFMTGRGLKKIIKDNGILFIPLDSMSIQTQKDFFKHIPFSNVAKEEKKIMSKSIPKKINSKLSSKFRNGDIQKANSSINSFEKISKKKINFISLNEGLRKMIEPNKF